MVLRGARDARPYLRRPTVVLPQSAHPAWFSAADTLGVVPIVVPIDVDGRVPIGPLTAAIKDDAVLVVASAPSYTHGIVDPVAWIAAATSAKGIPLHVDASSGGWALAYAELTGRVRQPWGFAVAGRHLDDHRRRPRARHGLRRVGAAAPQLDRPRATQLAALTLRGPLETAVAWQPAGGVVAEVAETLREVGHERCAELALDALDATARLGAGLVDARGISAGLAPRRHLDHPARRRQPATCYVFADALQAAAGRSRPCCPRWAARSCGCRSPRRCSRSSTSASPRSPRPPPRPSSAVAPRWTRPWSGCSTARPQRRQRVLRRSACSTPPPSSTPPTRRDARPARGDQPAAPRRRARDPRGSCSRAPRPRQHPDAQGHAPVETGTHSLPLGLNPPRLSGAPRASRRPRRCRAPRATWAAVAQPSRAAPAGSRPSASRAGSPAENASPQPVVSTDVDRERRHLDRHRRR